MSNCRNCKTEISQNYCPQCGDPFQLKRIDGHYIQHEITHILHFEKGIFYTIKELLLRPGENVRTFVSENRSRLVKPIIFIIITSLIYTLISHFFHLEGYIKVENPNGISTNAIDKWVHNNYGYSNIIMGLFIAFWLKVFFSKNAFNYFEILILLCFVIGMGMLIFSVFAIAEGLTKFKLLPVSGCIYIIYACWAVGQFFNKRKISGYLKALAAYILGMISFSVGIFLLAFIADLLIKH